MKKRTVIFLWVMILIFAAPLFADECMEGDCDDGFGTGFTDANKIYEGEWKNGYPHGQGKLYVSKGKVIEGIWKKGELVEEKKAGQKNEKEKEEKDK